MQSLLKPLQRATKLQNGHALQSVYTKKQSGLRLFSVSKPVLNETIIKLRNSPPIYFDTPSSNFYLGKASPQAIKLGSTTVPFQSFIQSLPHGDTDSYGESSGEAGFTSFQLYPIPPPGQFVDNSQFINSVLFPTLSKHVHECAEYNRLAEGELFNGGSTLHIYDLRAPPPYGRIPEVQDILGTVRLQEAEHFEDGSEESRQGKVYKVSPIVPGSFEPNPMYRILTMNGFIHLSDLLQKKVAKICRNE